MRLAALGSTGIRSGSRRRPNTGQRKLPVYRAGERSETAYTGRRPRAADRVRRREKPAALVDVLCDADGDGVSCGFFVEENPSAVAVGALLGERLEETLGDVLSRHLDQAEM